jgi:hypothetical protein
MDLGDHVLVNDPRHPLNGLQGKIVGRRGLRVPDDLWLLVYVPSRMRSFLIPQSMLTMERRSDAPQRTIQ